MLTKSSSYQWANPHALLLVFWLIEFSSSHKYHADRVLRHFLPVWKGGNFTLPSRSTQMRKVQCTLYTNLRQEEKAGKSNFTQILRIAKKDQDFNLAGRKEIYVNLLEHFTKASMLVTHWNIFQNFLNFKQWLVFKTFWADKFYFCFELRVTYTFYSCSSVVSTRCHIFKTCFQSRAMFVFDSKLDWTGRSSNIKI